MKPGLCVFQLCLSVHSEVLKVICKHFYDLNSVLFADVHGFHPHGPSGKETEPESSRKREGERKGHRPYKFPQGQRKEEEREEMLLEKMCKKRRKEGLIKTFATPILWVMFSAPKCDFFC